MDSTIYLITLFFLGLYLVIGANKSLTILSSKKNFIDIIALLIGAVVMVFSIYFFWAIQFPESFFRSY